MAMGLLAHHLTLRGMEARVHSAGTLGWGGPATNHAVETLAGRGLDLSGHESRRIKGEDVAEADLIIGVTRDHVHGSSSLTGLTGKWSTSTRFSSVDHSPPLGLANGKIRK